jgi:hypothetical protein
MAMFVVLAILIVSRSTLLTCSCLVGAKRQSPITLIITIMRIALMVMSNRRIPYRLIMNTTSTAIITQDLTHDGLHHTLVDDAVTGRDFIGCHHWAAR